MDFIDEIDEMVMSSSEDEIEVEVRPDRRTYRIFERAIVEDYDDVDFRMYYRLNKAAFWHLHGMVRETIEGDCRRSRELTAEQKLLVVLRLLACGSFQQTAADYIGMAQTTVSRILPSVQKCFPITFRIFIDFFSIRVIKVCDAILLYLHEFVRMPQTDNERLAKAAAFAAIADFPRCIGAIDCTHIRMSSPGGDIVSFSYAAFRKLHRFTLVFVLLSIQSEAFRNRHGYFSMNVQTIADSDLRIQNVVAR